MGSNPKQLLALIQADWDSANPCLRLAAIDQIGSLADQGIELPRDGVAQILATALYNDFRSYPTEIWVSGLLALGKVQMVFGPDFEILGPPEHGDPLFDPQINDRPASA